MPQATHPHFDVQSVNGVTVVTFLRRIFGADEYYNNLNGDLDCLAEQEGHKLLLLNFCKVGHVSSVELGKLLKLKKKLRAVQGHLKLCGLQPDLLEVFRITRLDQVFEIHDGQQAALDTF